MSLNTIPLVDRENDIQYDAVGNPLAVGDFVFCANNHKRANDFGVIKCVGKKMFTIDFGTKYSTTRRYGRELIKISIDKNVLDSIIEHFGLEKVIDEYRNSIAGVSGYDKRKALIEMATQRLLNDVLVERLGRKNCSIIAANIYANWFSKNREFSSYILGLLGIEVLSGEGK